MLTHGLPQALLNGHTECAEVLTAALRAGRVTPRVKASAEEADAYRRALQVKFAARLEAGARGDAAVAVRLFGMACEEATGQHAPGPVRQLLAVLLMQHGFLLWSPATQPRV